jgi:hypothetical protein
MGQSRVSKINQSRVTYLSQSRVSQTSQSRVTKTSQSRDPDLSLLTVEENDLHVSTYHTDLKVSPPVATGMMKIVTVGGQNWTKEVTGDADKQPVA